jgi:2-polyprenyl-3-methyl-5-hydroxy-6-metoxy-1,4-benzoquinol methylase
LVQTLDKHEKNSSQAYEADFAENFHEQVDGFIREDWAEMINDTPNLSTANILDAGCGSGLFTKYLRQITTGNVFGVDLAEDMLKIAEKDQLNASKQITYRNLDITSDISKALGLDPEYFDVVNSCWVLVHAQNKDMLSEMIKSLYKTLKKGGVFIGITQNPEITLQDIKNLEEYGTFYERKNPEVPLEDGEAIHVKFCKNGKIMWEGEDYHYSRETYMSAFLEAGFTKVEFIPLRRPKVLTGNKYIDESTQDGICFRAFK